MANSKDIKRKIWIVTIFTLVVDSIASLFGGNTIFGNSSKAKK